MTIHFEKLLFDSLSGSDTSTFWTTKARFARAGVQTYPKSECVGWPGIENVEGDTVRVLRPESVVFDADAMKSFENSPMTVEHESGMVDGGNAKGIIVGAASYPVEREGDALVVPVTIYDADAIVNAKTGKRRQLSAGYDLDAEYKPGTDEKYGAYDFVMTKWTGNHITITEAGKAGPEFYLGDKMSDENKAAKPAGLVTRSIDGVDYQFSEQSAQVFDRILGERDAAKAESENLKKQILTDSDIEARVRDRAAIMDSARKLNKDAKFDDKSVEQIVLDAVTVKYAGMDLDGKSSDYVRALFDSAVASVDAEHEKKEVNDRAMSGAKAQDSEPTGYAAKRAEFIAKHSGRR